MTSVRPDLIVSAELCPGVRTAVTSRHGGVSSGSYSYLNLGYSVGDDDASVRGNRSGLTAAIAAGPVRIAWMRQVHGAAVARVTGPAAAEREGSQEADAIFTDVPGLGLGVLSADCAPVLLADPVARLAGAAHAGRPGLALGVVPALVAAMMAAGADPGRMHALIGPSVCGRCYEVPAWLADEVCAVAPGAACVTRLGTPGIDIRAGLHGQLAVAGVGTIADDLRCTIESAELYSYRRDGITGRFASLIWLS